MNEWFNESQSRAGCLIKDDLMENNKVKKQS